MSKNLEETYPVNSPWSVKSWGIRFALGDHALDAFQSPTRFLLWPQKLIDTIFNISWQIFIMKSKKVIKCHFVSALPCKFKCWLSKQFLATFYLKRLTNCVNAICFLMGSIYFRSESVCHLIVTWCRALEKFSWVWYKLPAETESEEHCLDLPWPWINWHKSIQHLLQTKSIN